jgi:hypothetical protein
MSDRGTLQALANALGRAVQPLRDALSNSTAFASLMRQLGWNSPEILEPIKELQPHITAVLGILEQDQITAEDVLTLLGRLHKLFEAIGALSRIADGDLPSGIDPTEFRQVFPSELRDFLLVEFLLDEQPRIGRLLETIGLLRLRRVPAAGKRLEYVKRQVAWPDLARMLKNPQDVFASSYKWGDSQFEAGALFRSLYALGNAYGLGVQLTPLQKAERDYPGCCPSLGADKQRRDDPAVGRWDWCGSAA